MKYIISPIAICSATALVMVVLSASCCGQSTLQRALQQGDISTIGSLIDRDPKLLNTPLPQSKKVPLHFAIQQRNLEVVKLLLERGAALDDQNPQKYTALHCAIT